jgi:hypothetical protein
MRLERSLGWIVATSIALAGCAKVPKSVREYAAALPGRADGQYATLDDVIRKQLVTMDALLQCKIDVEDKKSESDSAACKCAKSSSADWTSDCRGWLGSHTPSGGSGSGSGTGSNTGSGSGSGNH